MALFRVFLCQSGQCVTARFLLAATIIVVSGAPLGNPWVQLIATFIGIVCNFACGAGLGAQSGESLQSPSVISGVEAASHNSAGYAIASIS